MIRHLPIAPLTELTQANARHAAKQYVAKMLTRGYTSSHAAAEIYSGYGSREEWGYLVTKGKITVPGCGKPNWTFKFAELEAELTAAETQRELFDIPFI